MLAPHTYDEQQYYHNERKNAYNSSQTLEGLDIEPQVITEARARKSDIDTRTFMTTQYVL